MKCVSRQIVMAAVLAALLIPMTPAHGQAGVKSEEFRYSWQLRNVIGRVAGLFLPNRGEGSLTFTRTNGHLKSELLITSPQSGEGEYFRYGSEIDSRTLQPIRAWSSYAWRGESKSKNEAIKQDGVFDIAAGIFAIRRDPPTKARRMEIWSDGKIYPVVVTPRGIEKRKVPEGMVQARHYTIRGVDIPGRRKWKGKLDLWLATDSAATPVEILISRSLTDVRLQLTSGS